MIPLPTPDSVKKGSAAAENEQRARTRDLASEEERLIRSVNSLRTEEESERERTSKALKEIKDEAKAVIADLAQQVKGLEDRREEAMKPIQDVRDEAASRNAKASERESIIIAREAKLKEAESSHSDILARLHDKKQELNEREEDVAIRERGALEEGQRLSKSGQELSAKWAEFYEKLSVANALIRSREIATEVGRAANEARSSELDKKAREQSSVEKRLIDGYQTLESAKREILEGKLTP